ncbi:MAG: DUF1501 domain-containing protein [Thermoanaerobaculales bacterium]|jgi:uncharacterized protein (DUF1501 family)|nr:DUF1501 domain-containing protein [Thermoanaerobaculales bacterium]
MSPRPTRRGFVAGCSAAIAGLAGSRFPRFAFADPETTVNNEILVVIFLRGGLDGLNLVVPISGNDRGYYESARPNIAVPLSGSNGALSLDGQFGLHRAAQPLHQLYQSGKVAVVNATGLNEASRSHFDSMEFIERGTPGNKTTATGWLARHFSCAHNLPPEIVMPSVSVGSTQATSLLGDRDTINLSDPDSFNLQIGPWEWRSAQRIALRHMYTDDTTWLHAAGLQALDAVDLVELNISGAYTPANGAVYPSGSFGDGLQVIAQMVKLDLGLRVSTFDLGGWDTHVSQGDGGGGYFSSLIGTLCEGLAALYTDLDGAGSANYTNRLTVVVQSEFGRRLFENADRGADHGHGNPMIIMSGNAVPGVHGAWPGIGPGQLFDDADLAVTTDFRRVLSEILIRRMGNNHLGYVFPGYTDYQPLGVVAGVDLPPDYSTTGDGIFADDFESGDTSAWG